MGGLRKRLLEAGWRNRYIRGSIELVQQLFVTLLVTLLLLLVVETVWEKSVSSQLNLNYLLIIVTAVGIVAFLAQPQGAEKKREPGLSRTNIISAVFAGLAGAAIAWYATKEVGWFAYLIATMSGGLIVILCILIWREGVEGEDS